ncbi:MAG: NAD(P)/FAD-dependent oxidoreductase [Kineosporiaceae bacterium]
MARVTVVGGGISGIACARALQRSGVEVEVLDRGHRLGGRMALRETDGHVVDIGASYFTVSDPGFAAVADDWRDRGLARGWTDTFHLSDGRSLTGTTTGPVRWAAPAGLRALVEDLARDLPVRHPVEVDGVERLPSGGWRVLVAGERAGVADAVVLAMPDPQAARLVPDELTGFWFRSTDGTDGSHGTDGATGAWPWEAVVSVSARWERRWWSDVDGVFVNAPGGGVVEWVADDGRRRGDGVPVLVAHSTGESARRWLADPDAARRPVLAAAASALGVAAQVPEPTWCHVQRWGLARPVRSRPAPPFALHPDGLGLCGDAWGDRSRVESAWCSGARLGAALAGALGATPRPGLD